MKRLVWAVLFSTPMLLLASPAQAQDPEGTLYFGYSYFRVDLENAEEGDAHGIEADYTYFLERHVGFTVSASVHRPGGTPIQEE